MALITNNISGSSADSWRIGITGSVRIGNPGANPFPSMPGSDVDFFVSGSRGGKGTSGVSVFGGDAVVSGSLTIGTGSVTITSNDIQFNAFDTRIQSGSNGLTFFDAGNTGGVTLSSLVAGAGGGDVDGPASATDNAIARFDGTTGKLIQDTAGVTIDDTNNVVTSGSFITKTGGGAQAVSLSNGGVISGSSDLQAGGNLTVAGTSTLVGVVSASGDLAVNGGDITTTASSFSLINTSATTVNFAGDATSLNIGASSGVTTVNNNLTVKGDLYISGTVTTIDSTVTEIKDPVIGLGFSSGSIALAAGDRGFIGGIVGTGNNVAFVWSNANSSFVATKTSSSPTGSISTPVDITGLQPVRASRFDVGGNAAFISSSNGNDLSARGPGAVSIISTANRVVINPAAGFQTEFQFGGASHAELTASAGSARFGALAGRQLILSGSTLNFNAGPNGINLQRDGVPYGVISGSTGVGGGLRIAGGDTVVVAELTLSGSTVTIGANAGTTTIRGGTVVGDQTTQNLFNTVATTLNIGGAATSAVNIGGNGGTATIVNPTVTLSNATTLNVNGVNPTIAGTSVGTLTLFNANLTSVNAFGAATNINIGADGTGNLYLKNAATNISGSAVIAGNSTLGSDSTDKIYFSGSAASSLIPDSNNAYDLGSPSLRWRNMYTGDLHLRNERGDWTIIEEREFLSITNNHSGRRYKFVMEEI